MKKQGKATVKGNALLKRILQRFGLLSLVIVIIFAVGACSKGVSDKEFDEIINNSKGELSLNYTGDVRLEYKMWDQIHVMASDYRIKQSLLKYITTVEKWRLHQSCSRP